MFGMFCNISKVKVSHKSFHNFIFYARKLKNSRKVIFNDYLKFKIYLLQFFASHWSKEKVCRSRMKFSQSLLAKITTMENYKFEFN